MITRGAAVRRLRGSVVAQRPFSDVFAAQSCAELGDQIFLVVLAWAVLSTGGGVDLGLVLMAWSAPRGVFLLFGGVLVDRGDRRLLGAGAGVALAGLVAALGFTYAADATSLPLWLAAAVGLGLLDGIRLPIGYTLIPLVVPEERVIDANRWSQVRLWTALMLGPPIGGALVAVVGVSAAFLVAAALYALSGVLLLALPPLRVARASRPNVLTDLVDGFRFVRRHEKLRLLLPVFAAVNLFVLGLLVVGIPLFVKEGLGGGAGELGLVLGSFGAGLMLGTISMGRFPTWFKTSTAGLFTLFALSDLGLALVGLSPTVVAAVAAFFFSGFCIGPASTLYQSLIQTTTPAEYLGRVSGMARSISFGLEPVSAALVGSLSRVVASGTLVVGGGLAAMTIDVFASVRGRALDRSGRDSTADALPATLQHAGSERAVAEIGAGGRMEG